MGLVLQLSPQQVPGTEFSSYECLRVFILILGQNLNQLYNARPAVTSTHTRSIVKMSHISTPSLESPFQQLCVSVCECVFRVNVEGKMNSLLTQIQLTAHYSPIKASSFKMFLAFK